ncbi:MAG: alpha-amylase family glycosyl hydrolase [Balneolaceae bacterium]
MRIILKINLLALLFFLPTQAQETIDVTFRYEANESALRAFAPGEFNNWGNNSSGQISVTDASLMTKDLENGFWYNTITLQVGGGTAVNAGKSGYAYKFHEQYNGSGSEWAWFTDPLNEVAIGDNNDSFIEVTNPLIFQMGRNNGILELGTDIWVTVAATNSDSIDVEASKFYFNGELAGTFENNYEKERQLFFIKNPEDFDLIDGLNKAKIVAVTKSGATVTDSLQFTFIGSDIDVKRERPAGLQDGITYSEDGTSVTFSLFAPYKEDVYVLGDFTNWTVDLDYKMFRDSVSTDSVWFWIEVDGLTPGTEYGMQYLVDSEILIPDPYSELVLDEGNDPFISESVFPNLKDYPTGKTSQLVTVITPGKEEYDWEVTDFEKPDKDELVIYELLLRDFIADHSYTTLIDTLDYLANLGINAIEFMPINEFDGNESWGYNPALHGALDKYYGSPNEFKRFVDEAHKRGIAIILDVVLNHSFGQNPIVRLWNEGEYGNPTSQNPYFNTAARHPFNVGYDMNHESEPTRYYSKRMMEYWIKEYKVDGYRFDLSKGFTQTNNPNDVGAWGAYDQSRINIWKDYSSHIWSIDPDAYVILEHFAAGSEEIALANEGMMLWGNMNHEYNEASMGYTSNLSGVLSQNRGFNDRHLVGYMESHDEQWLMFKNRSFANSAGDYNIRNLPTALDRMELVGAFFFTLPGPKMIWQFGELGYGYGDNGEQCLNDSEDCPASAPGRTANKPIRWDYNADPDRKDLYNAWSEIIKLRRSSPAFTKPEGSFYALNGNVKYIRLEHSDSDVVIIGNFGVTSTTENVDFTQDGTWHDFFGATTISVTGIQASVDLAPGEFKIYTTKEFNTSTSNEEVSDNDSPSSFKLYQNYPNPFNPTTNITFDVAQTGAVSLEVYDMLGRKVAELINDVKTAGTYTVSFDATRLSSGVYFARYQAGQSIQIQKMTLLK